jgi:hypothetical protein
MLLRENCKSVAMTVAIGTVPSKEKPPRERGGF